MILETLCSAIVGLLGTSLTTYSNYRMEKLRAENAREILRLQNELMIAEVEANIKVARVSSEIEEIRAEGDAFTASQAAQKKALPTVWVQVLFETQGLARFLTIPVGVLLLLLLGLGDAIQHFMRSFLTLYSLAIASWVTYQSYTIVSSLPSFDISLLTTTWKDSCEVVMLLCVTMVTWWFGDRRVAKHLMHMKDGGKQ